MSRRIIIGFALWLCVGTAAAQAAGTDESSLTGVFGEANKAASVGDYDAAIARYQELVDAGVEDPDVYFNLATSYAHVADYPRAILYYERALVLRPSDSKASEGLHDAERALEELRASAEGEASIARSASVGAALYGRFTENGLAYALVLSNFAFFGLLAGLWVGRRRGRLLYWFLAAAAAALFFSAVGLAVKVGALRDGPRAVILEDRVSLTEGPDPRARVRGEARSGDRGEIVGKDREFVKFRSAGGQEGWVRAEVVGSIDHANRMH